MIFEEFLSKTVHENFDGLLSAHGFQYLYTDEDNRNISLLYRNNSLVVRIKYNYPNHYLDFDLCKTTDINKLIGAEFIGLPHIIKDQNPEFKISEYNEIMPKVIPIEESLVLLAGLVKEYAIPYLEGKTWKTWRDV